MFNILNNYQAPQNRLYGLFSRSTYSTEYRLMCVGVKSPVTSFVYNMNTAQHCRTLRWWCCSVCGCCQTHAVGFCAVISKMADFNFRERVALMTCRVTPFTGQSVACILLTSHFWINSARLEPCTNKVAGTRYYKLLENPENWVGTSRYQWERVISVL